MKRQCSSFAATAKAQQTRFRATLSEAGRTPTDARGIRHGHLLALGREHENLFPHIPDGGALRFFADRRIGWFRHAASGDAAGKGPTRNLVSSQVACVNFLLGLARIPHALEVLMRTLDPDLEGLVPIEDSDGHVSPVEFEWVGWNEPLEGGRITRGSNQTSADAVLVGRTSVGLRAYVIEWKFTETGTGEDKGAGDSGAVRLGRYTARYEDPNSSFDPAVPLREHLFEPFYQLMRMRLLADRFVTEGVTKKLLVNDARVIVVCPRDNDAYRTAVTATPLARRFPHLQGVDEVFRATLKNPDAFVMASPEDLFAAVCEGGCRAEVEDWIAYHALRYGWPERRSVQ